MSIINTLILATITVCSYCGRGGRERERETERETERDRDRQRQRQRQRIEVLNILVTYQYIIRCQ